ncbi:CAP domain-containing protein [Chitinimonas koreensis]|uniref:CAP domain-containing protein n=1 Tax=Chitinimonas koreensis TaxID=356302 RepID=UPI0003FADE59|nr:hypothetical protein [Chitinimonas koreensis]QNM95513.1 hypothetical protein H9L41_16805 [Chitinimonas koreensis]
MMKHLKTFAGLALILTLGACGGGGGGSSGPSNGGTPQPTPVPTPTPTPVPSCSNNSTNPPACDNFQATVPAASYTAGSYEAKAFEQLNAVRKAMGIGLLAQSAALDTAAASHRAYGVQNDVCNNDPGAIDPATGLMKHHSEQPGLPGYTGSTPILRANAAGYGGTVATEVATCASTTDPRADLAWYLSSVYHRLPLLDPGLRDLGMKIVVPASNEGIVTGNVVNFGYKTTQQPTPASYLGTYPTAGQSDVSLIFEYASENPNPLPDLSPATQRFVGNPVSIHAEVGKLLIVDSFTLSVANNPVPVRLLTKQSDVNGLGGHVAFIVPLAPLMPGTTYTAKFTGTIDGASRSKEWSFTTVAASMQLSPAGDQTITSIETLPIQIKTPSGLYTARVMDIQQSADEPIPASIDREASRLVIRGKGGAVGTTVFTIQVNDTVYPEFVTTFRVTVTP